MPWVRLPQARPRPAVQRAALFLAPEPVLQRLLHPAQLLVVALLLEARVRGGALLRAALVVVRGVVEVDVVHHLLELLAVEQPVGALRRAALDDAPVRARPLLHLHLFLVRGVRDITSERETGPFSLQLALLHRGPAVRQRHSLTQRLLLFGLLLLLKLLFERLLRCCVRPKKPCAGSFKFRTMIR